MINGKKSKLMSMLVTLLMVLSLVTIFAPATSGTTLKVSDDGTTYGLTPGDVITVEVTDGTLTEDEEYEITVWDGTQQVSLEEATADSNGDLSVDIHVPGYDELGQNPIGTWNLSLWDESDTLIDEVNIDITNYYKVRIKVDGEFVDHVIHNHSYDAAGELEFHIFNWTGSKWDEVTGDDADLTVELYDPEDVFTGEDNTDLGSYKWNPDYTFDYIDSGDNINRECMYWLYVENNLDGNKYSYVPIPVKLDFTATIPENIKWDDNIYTIDGYVKEGDDDGTGVYDYDVSVFAPVLDGYVEVTTVQTFETGRYQIQFTANQYPAGTWYIGTYDADDDAVERIDETSNLNIEDFIAYESFPVVGDDSAKVKVEDPDEVITGFDQVINVSIYDSWDGEYYDEMNLHFTGLDCYYNGTEYADDEIVYLDGANLTGYSSNEKYAYYEFEIMFNETGTGTIFATWDLDNDQYEDNDKDNTDMRANITGETSITVVSADDINVIIINPPTEVVVDDSTDEWINGSNPTTTIKVYADTQGEPINATIYITGCGLDIEIEEDDLDYWVDNGEYEIELAPKVGGTLTFEVVNDSEELETTKDYSVSGLRGSVTTSINDDTEFTVGTTEEITVDVTGGDYAEVHVSYFDRDWDNGELVNDTIGDAETEGEGLNGIFSFTPDEDFVENVGYLVVAASAGGFFMYDIVEINADHDLVIDVQTPTDGNQTFTVGLPTDIELQVVDGNGDPVDDCDTVIGELLDEEGEVVQEFSFDEAAGDGMWDIEDQIIWWPGDLLITATNQTDAAEHDGNATFTVEMATITFTPDIPVIAGIERENITVTVTTQDALGNPLPEGTKLFINIHEDADDTQTDPADGDSFELDEDGAGEFEIELVGDSEGTINVSLQAAWVSNVGNETNGVLNIEFPDFEVSPSTISTKIDSATVMVTARDGNLDPIPGLNITLTPVFSSCIVPPDPVETNEDGVAEFDVAPLSSGKANVTIIQGLEWEDDGTYSWDDFIYTESILTITHQTLDVTVLPTKVYAGGSFTVTVKDDGTPVEDAKVSFEGGTTINTDSSGKATFEDVDDPGIESREYKIKIIKDGYPDVTAEVLVINTYQIKISGPSSNPAAGEKFTVTVIAKGSGLAGATVTFNGKEVISDNNGKASFTAPDKKGDYEITATFDDPCYKDASYTVTIAAAGTPGFELLTLVAAIGVAFILLRRRRR